MSRLSALDDTAFGEIDCGQQDPMRLLTQKTKYPTLRTIVQKTTQAFA